MSSVRLFIGAVFAALALQSPAAAQNFNMIDWNKIQFESLIMQPPVVDFDGSGDVAQDEPDEASLLTYTRDPAVSVMVISRIAAELEAIEPASSTQFSAVMAQMDVFALIGTEAERLGMNSQNVADAMALWMVNSWMILNRIDGDPSVAALQSVSSQVISAFSVVGDLGMAEAQRQELAEELLLRTVIASEAYEGLKGNPETLAGLDAQISKAGQAMDFDFAKFDLTDAGFVARQ